MFSYDEEVGCLGVSSMIAAAREILPQPGMVLVGEPTAMRVATQHKGICMAQTKVVGVEAHSSLTHRGESAVMLAGELIAHLADAARKLAAANTAAGKEVDPPYTTISVNRICGGTANNILAGLCEFIWDIRPIPGESAELILKELASRAEARLAHLSAAGKQCHIETTVLADVPALRAEIDGIAADIVRAAVGDRKPDIAVPFGTEGGYFQRAGWSTVVCGPGSIDQAHRPDEFIEHGQLSECEALLDRLVNRLKN
jgi:acetylornithine deacetylase